MGQAGGVDTGVECDFLGRDDVDRAQRGGIADGPGEGDVAGPGGQAEAARRARRIAVQRAAETDIAGAGAGRQHAVGADDHGRAVDVDVAAGGTVRAGIHRAGDVDAGAGQVDIAAEADALALRGGAADSQCAIGVQGDVARGGIAGIVHIRAGNQGAGIDRADMGRGGDVDITAILVKPAGIGDVAGGIDGHAGRIEAAHPQRGEVAALGDDRLRGADRDIAAIQIDRATLGGDAVDAVLAAAADCEVAAAAVDEVFADAADLRGDSIRRVAGIEQAGRIQGIDQQQTGIDGMRARAIGLRHRAGGRSQFDATVGAIGADAVTGTATGGDCTGHFEQCAAGGQRDIAGRAAAVIGRTGSRRAGSDDDPRRQIAGRAGAGGGQGDRAAGSAVLAAAGIDGRTGRIDRRRQNRDVGAVAGDADRIHGTDRQRQLAAEIDRAAGIGGKSADLVDRCAEIGAVQRETAGAGQAELGGYDGSGLRDRVAGGEDGAAAGLDAGHGDAIGIGESNGAGRRRGFAGNGGVVGGTYLERQGVDVVVGCGQQNIGAGGVEGFHRQRIGDHAAVAEYH